MRSWTIDLLPMLGHAALYALLWTIPVLALLAIGLDAVLPRPDAVTGQRAGAWLVPVVVGTAAAIYFGLMLGYLYVQGVLNERIPQFIGRQVRTAMQRIRMAAQRAGLGMIWEVVRARAVAIALIALVPLLGIALVWIGTAAFSAAPWSVVLIIGLVIVVRMTW